MKQRITSSVKEILQDRNLTILLGVFITVCLLLIGFLAISIRASELQVVVHYTSFGNTNFYRDKWYYLLTFALLVVLMAITHIVLVYKILQSKGRSYAIPFVWLSLLMVLIAAAIFYQVLKIASLS
jgi:hypothetical protein